VAPFSSIDVRSALYLDTETTGLRPPHDDLVEVALVDADGRRG